MMKWTTKHCKSSVYTSHGSITVTFLKDNFTGVELTPQQRGTIDPSTKTIGGSTVR